MSTLESFSRCKTSPVSSKVYRNDVSFVVAKTEVHFLVC
jgi:hypothetical protein